MKIPRENLYEMTEYAKYIKESSHLVRDVYCQSIYLNNGSGVYLSWNTGSRLDQEREDMILRGINAMCNTEFEFED